MSSPLGKPCMATFGAGARVDCGKCVNQVLRKQVRLAAGREEQPSLGLIDSQSVEMAQKGALNKVLMVTKKSKGASGI